MLRYMHDKNVCRSKFIANYFGDFAAAPCGICDICLQSKKQNLTEEMFKKIEQRIYNHIPEEGIAIKELLHFMHGVKKDYVWKVINFLQSEKILNINTLGIATINKKSK